MPALTVADPSDLARLGAVRGLTRPVRHRVSGVPGVEGAGFPVFRGFAGLPPALTDPFVLLDQAGPTGNEPLEAVGAPWHPHRGFETVTYVIDGAIDHRDSNGGGGRIDAGDTQWMTAGSGVLHDELPTEAVLQRGGWTHGIQLWVNLPAALKWTTPRYQTVAARDYALLAGRHGDSYLRVIAGEIDGHRGPGSTHTPITLAHATLAPGAALEVPWPAKHTAMVFTIAGHGMVGSGTPLGAHQSAVLGPGDHIALRADTDQHPHGPDTTSAWEVLLLGGQPLREPVAHYGPFVMNTEAEIRQAFADFQAGRLGTVPAATLD